MKARMPLTEAQKHAALIARAPEYLAGKLSDPVVANDNKEAA